MMVEVEVEKDEVELFAGGCVLNRFHPRQIWKVKIKAHRGGVDETEVLRERVKQTEEEVSVGVGVVGK